MRADYLGVVVMHGGSADDEVHIRPDIIAAVADVYFYALFPQ